MNTAGVALALVSAEESRAAQLERWLDADFLPACRAVPGVAHAQGYVAPRPLMDLRRRVATDRLAAFGGQYLALAYLAGDPERAWRSLLPQWDGLGERPGARLLLTSVMRLEGSLLRKGATASLDELPRSPHRGLFFTLAQVVDQTRRQELHRWYGGKHIPELLETRGFLACYRFLGTDTDGRETFLQVYYLDEDPLAASADLRARGPRWTEEERAMEIESLRKPLIFAWYQPLTPPARPPAPPA